MEKILLIDDSRFQRKTIAKTIISAGYEVAEADSAESGMAVLKADDSIDLVVTDIHMPGGDGIAFIRKIREEGYKIPIIALSADVEGALERYGSDAKMDDLINKPLKPYVLEYAIKRLLKRSKKTGG